MAGQAVAGERSVTPFELLPPGDIVVPVTIDGQGPFRMLLDTGASRSAVTTAVARLLDSRVVGETTMVTPAGRERRPLVLLKRVALGGSGSSSVVGMQLDDDDLNPAIDGLIGQDILAARVYTIDYTETSHRVAHGRRRRLARHTARRRSGSRTNVGVASATR